MAIKALDEQVEAAREAMEYTAGVRAKSACDVAEYCFARAAQILDKYSIDGSVPLVALAGHRMRSYDQLEYRKHKWSD